MRIIILSIICGFVFTSCQDFAKANYISGYEKFVDDCSKSYTKYTEEERVKADAKFKEYSETEYEKYKGQLTPEDQKKINELAGRYIAIVLKQKTGELGNDLQNMLEMGKGALDEIEKELKK